MSETILFCATSDPDYDQRMQRICGTLSAAGYRVKLTGRALRPETTTKADYWVTRLPNWCKNGVLMYAEYNIRLFFWLLFQKADLICAIDLDSSLAVYLVSRIKRIPRIMDAHEYFSELKEVVTRPGIQFWWQKLEAFLLPRFPDGYTVSETIATAFKERYGVDYRVIRNVPLTEAIENPKVPKKRALIYQGAVNEGRGLEYLIPAMTRFDAELHIYGNGNFMSKALELTTKLDLSAKIKFFDMVSPETLRAITTGYMVGLNLVEPVGKNQLFSLANKFFDYIHAGVPQVTMNFPEYAKINSIAPVALLINELSEKGISESVNLLLTDTVVYDQLAANCSQLKGQFCWEVEAEHLLEIYKKVLTLDKTPAHSSS